MRGIPDWFPNRPVPSGGGYASLVGPGQTSSPGDLTQTGGFEVEDTIFGNFTVNTNGEIIMAAAIAAFLSAFNCQIHATDILSLTGDNGGFIGDSSPSVGVQWTVSGNAVKLIAQELGFDWKLPNIVSWPARTEWRYSPNRRPRLSRSGAADQAGGVSTA